MDQSRLRFSESAALRFGKDLAFKPSKSLGCGIPRRKHFGGLANIPFRGSRRLQRYEACQKLSRSPPPYVVSTPQEDARARLQAHGAFYCFRQGFQIFPDCTGSCAEPLIRPPALGSSVSFICAAACAANP